MSTDRVDQPLSPRRPRRVFYTLTYKGNTSILSEAEEFQYNIVLDITENHQLIVFVSTFGL